MYIETTSCEFNLGCYSLRASGWGPYAYFRVVEEFRSNNSRAMQHDNTGVMNEPQPIVNKNVTPNQEMDALESGIR